MEVLHSLRDFLWGVVKRVWIYLPLLLLDPFDIAQRVFGKNYPVPQWVAWLLFSIACATAIILTYHELRKRKVAFEAECNRLKQQLDDQRSVQEDIEFVNAKMREWRQTDLQNARLYISAPEKRQLIESIRNRYAESEDVSYVKAVMDDYHTLWHYIDLIINFFRNVQIDLTIRYRNNTKMKELINVYLGTEIMYFYEKIGFYEDVTVKYWKSCGRTEEPNFGRLYNEMKMLSQVE